MTAIRPRVYDVTLYWHDGGCVPLGTVAAMSKEEAQAAALRQYVAQSKKHEAEIYEGGGYQLEADHLTPEDAAAWRKAHKP